jgi:TPR repeat protein
MRKLLLFACAIVALVLSGAAALAGPWEDGMVAYNRGDYVPALKVFQALAQAGNTKAQGILGVMYRKGEGVTPSSARAFMWLSIATARGDTTAKVKLREMAREMTPAEMSHAKEMMAACEASDHRNCEY